MAGARLPCHSHTSGSLVCLSILFSKSCASLQLTEAVRMICQFGFLCSRQEKSEERYKLTPLTLRSEKRKLCNTNKVMDEVNVVGCVSSGKQQWINSCCTRVWSMNSRRMSHMLNHCNMTVTYSTFITSLNILCVVWFSYCICSFSLNNYYHYFTWTMENMATCGWTCRGPSPPWNILLLLCDGETSVL